MTQELQLDCLDQLEATPAILRGLMCDLSVEDTEWKPAPDRFSVAEVLAHLSHSEGHCYRTRVDQFVSEELPEFEPDDAQMYLELYRNANAKDAFDHFEEQRETNVEGAPDFFAVLKAPGSATDRLTRFIDLGVDHFAVTSPPCSFVDTPRPQRRRGSNTRKHDARFVVIGSVLFMIVRILYAKPLL
jgi:hypothetical protein